KKGLLGCHDEELRNQVRYLPAYFAKLKSADAGTIAVMEPDLSVAEESHQSVAFKRCFVAPAPARFAFPYCRPIIALDGTFLKGKVKLVLLLAATFDANDSLIILAWALVPSESTSSWTWFIRNLKTAFPRVESKLMTVVSDRDKGLMAAVDDQLPDVSHAYCCYHLAANLKKHHGASTQPLFWRCVYAMTKAEFDLAMDQLRVRCKEAADYLCAPEQEHTHWATYAFNNRRWGLVTSNLAEVANSLLVSIRSLPLLSMLSSIYEHQQEKYHARRLESQGWSGYITPTALRTLKLASDAARAALSSYLRQPPISHVHQTYTTSNWSNTYTNPFVPVSTSDFPVAEWLEAPELTQTKGRPRIKRMEKGAVQVFDHF
ncbi:unnamed protein product, partial [Tilletia controversa]